jgi:RNA polymerase sigma-70 factor (ECF subfamily)
LPPRLDSVLQVIYLVFNEGYSTTTGVDLTRRELSAEAIRLGRLLLELLPEAEVAGLLALMLLHDARRLARTSAQGDLIPLEEQDRNLWDREQIAEGCELVLRALRSQRFGAYALAAVHAETPQAEQTDWSEITGLYDVLLRINPSAVVELNRAVAIAMCDGPAQGVQLIEAIRERGTLAHYHPVHAALADLYRRLGRIDESRAAYSEALRLARQEPERRLIRRRLAELNDRKNS